MTRSNRNCEQRLAILDLSKRLVSLAAVVCVLFLLAYPLIGASTAYVVLRSDGRLVRISPDGTKTADIARVPGGEGLALDAAGNYIIAAKNTLVRVTHSGIVTHFASAPPDAYWAAIAVDSRGDFILADGKRPVLWRVPADGNQLTQIARYQGLEYTSRRDVTVCLDSSGDYLVLVDGIEDHRIGASSQLFRVSPNGSISVIPLKGVRTKEPFAMIPAGPGRFLFTAKAAPDRVTSLPQLFSLTTDGQVALFADLRSSGTLSGLALDPVGGSIIVAARYGGALLRISPDGSKASQFTRQAVALVIVPEPQP